MIFTPNRLRVSIHPLHNIWLHKHLGEASGDGPSLSLMQGWLPLTASSHAPCLPTPAFVIFSKLWLSERRHMCVLQVLLQHSSMQLPEAIPGGAL